MADLAEEPKTASFQFYCIIYQQCWHRTQEDINVDFCPFAIIQAMAVTVSTFDALPTSDQDRE